MYKVIPVSHGILIKEIPHKAQELSSSVIALPERGMSTLEDTKHVKLEKHSLEYWEVVAIGTGLRTNPNQSGDGPIIDIQIGDRVILHTQSQFSSLKSHIIQKLTRGEDNNHYGLVENRHIAFVIRDDKVPEKTAS